MSCEPGGQEGAKANQGYTATLLTCSWSSCKPGFPVVKVLIRPAGENLGCDTATFLIPSIQQSFVSEEWGVKLTEHAVFIMARWSHVVCALQPRGLIWSNQIGFSKHLPCYSSITGLISGCPALRRDGWISVRQDARWITFWWAGSNSCHLFMQLPLFPGSLYFFPCHINKWYLAYGYNASVTHSVPSVWQGPACTNNMWPVLCSLCDRISQSYNDKAEGQGGLETMS